jgi:hypothetical protein
LLKKVTSLSSSGRKPQSATIMELRHKFDLNILLSQTNMARSNFYYQKKIKSVDKYQVIKELIKFITNIKVAMDTGGLQMN